MGGLPLDNPLAFTFCITGTIISAMQYLSPLPTFYGVVYLEGWNIEGLTNPEPYIISLFSCMLRIYHALINSSECFMLLIINIFGCFFNIVYITIHLVYSPNKMYIGMLIMILDVVLFALIFLLTRLLWKDEECVNVLSWIYLICLSITAVICPSSTIYQVIKTRSIKGMQFYNSLLTTLGSASWLAYVKLINNKDIVAPSALSLVFGVIQMVVYMKFKYYDSEQNVSSLQSQTAAGEVEIEMVAAKFS
ncbi:Multitransmembrane protein [Dioscorea alata]|uniref:Multitransmembrane protein n=1 Tax=Dioscorea alata TaxID=55571 RepID=A0ACB7UTQ5_DIOAL|nr:Multitransmembrane protein [Dioscorea alata]